MINQRDMHEMNNVRIEKGDSNLQHQNGGDDVVCTRQVNKQTWYPLPSSDPFIQNSYSTRTLDPNLRVCTIPVR